MRLTRIKITAVAALAAAALLAGCAETVDGTGARASGASAASSAPGSSAPATAPGTDFPTADAPTKDFPSTGGSSTPPTDGGSTASSTTTSCPKPYYAPAQLSFTCITSGMTATSDAVWPLLEIKQVESSGWALQEGAALYTGTETSLETIALSVRSAMIDSGAYLDSPKVTTLRVQTGKFGTRRAVIIHSLITLNPQAAATRKTKVKEERLWILAVQTSPGVVSLWHASLPDLAKSLWPKVQANIATIKVTK